MEFDVGRGILHLLLDVSVSQKNVACSEKIFFFIDLLPNLIRSEGSRPLEILQSILSKEATFDLAKTPAVMLNFMPTTSSWGTSIK